MSSARSDEIWMEAPANDVPSPQVSIVIPALNEEITVGDFVAWCHEGLASAGVEGEIIIVDSSTDSTAERALAAGARVLHVPKRGLGQAYIDALPHIRGEWIIMGDADCTYDFRRLKPFVDGFRAGHEFVMGSRWKGSIEKGAMPPHHQYFGTPVTTWILNRLYGSRFSDIHCGMRGITKRAFERMLLQSTSWEYASEMVLKSVHMRLSTTEVPVHFLKDREGRLSHHRREGWFSPFKAAWINLKAMFVYGADFFTLAPGIVMLVLGLALALPVTFGPYSIGSVTFSQNWQLLGVMLAVLGMTGTMLGATCRILFDYTGVHTRFWLRLLSYTRTVGLAALVFAAGLALTVPLVREYLGNDLRVPEESSDAVHLGISGVMLIILGATTFVFTLLLHAAALASRFRPERTL